MGAKQTIRRDAHVGRPGTEKARHLQEVLVQVRRMKVLDEVARVGKLNLSRRQRIGRTVAKQRRKPRVGSDGTESLGRGFDNEGAYALLVGGSASDRAIAGAHFEHGLARAKERLDETKLQIELLLARLERRPKMRKLHEELVVQPAVEATPLFGRSGEETRGEVPLDIELTQLLGRRAARNQALLQLIAASIAESPEPEKKGRIAFTGPAERSIKGPRHRVVASSGVAARPAACEVKSVSLRSSGSHHE